MRESRPGPSGGQEEGGFIVRDAAGTLQVIRWPEGAGNTIYVPPHRGCRLGEFDIIASFHTHPNTGPEYLQEPSETDKRAVRDDADLKAPDFIGELVISAALSILSRRLEMSFNSARPRVSWRKLDQNGACHKHWTERFWKTNWLYRWRER